MFYIFYHVFHYIGTNYAVIIEDKWSWSKWTKDYLVTHYRNIYIEVLMNIKIGHVRLNKVW